ncbi:isopenicillin N synthase family dioxygenase [Vreelandella boliviensis]|uniref:2OG-Fe(II) oxygenase n=1 Tax=Vreelandella boliviensis LC1 TaxID=1072583 RepID=A0A265DXP8_9GAMM|nr:2-oxoglutarate and iron-dependent oxygenase domain-containing protein [Halomonas boliviensis]EHJ91257.1 Isopenicillin N synthase [Halomonas boliviensis LC1]OZT74099.1 2OG-Fe(II) oxygenase [Halomonas boliviensis LC1]
MSQASNDLRLADFQAIPVIDIGDLLSGDLNARKAVAEQLGRAAREVGFFQMVGHGINPSLRQGLINQAKRFFAQPTETKMERYIGLYHHHRGYVPPGEESPDPNNPDMKEAFDLAFELPSDDPDVLAGTALLGPNPWPALEGFRQPVAAYYDAAYQVGRALMGGFALALGHEESHFLHHVTKPPSQLRLIHYPYNPDAEDAQGIGAHTDYECFTLLLPTAPGLEVMNGAGEWIDVPFRDDALVVNIGDMLEIWSNGEFVATSHRVRKVKEERYSFPLFFACDYHTVVAPLPELVKRHGQAFYPPLKAGDHLYAQTIQTFNYLRERLARGEIALPDGAREVGSLGQHGKHKETP